MDMQRWKTSCVALLCAVVMGCGSTDEGPGADAQSPDAVNTTDTSSTTSMDTSVEGDTGSEDGPPDTESTSDTSSEGDTSDTSSQIDACTDCDEDTTTTSDADESDATDTLEPADCAGVPGGAAYEDECGVCDDDPSNDDATCVDCDECGLCDTDPTNDCMLGLEYYGTVVPTGLTPVPAPEDYTVFEPNVTFGGGPDGINHEPTAEQGAGKLMFNRVYRASKHGVDRYEQYGIYHWWLGSYGNNSIEGGLWVNPKATGPHYYPSLHIAGIGDMYYACNDVQFGSGLYEVILGDRWLTMIQFSNRVLFVPGVNIAFDKDQPDHAEDDGIWVGWGWTSLELDHPLGYKFWLSVAETYDFQGPINGYVPEHFNWIDPEKVEEGSYAENMANQDPFGTFATHGAKPNYGLGNEQYLNGLDMGDGLFYVPTPKMPSAKSREYIVAHIQSIESSDMSAYSAALSDSDASPLIPSSYVAFDGLYQSTHSRLKVSEQIAGEEHITIIEPPFTVGYDDIHGFIDWGDDFPEGVDPKGDHNGYLYYQKQAEKWTVEQGASPSYTEHPHIYRSEMAPSPDGLSRVPEVESRYFSFKERNPTHPEFANWDTTGMTRTEVTLQNGSVATYVWFKFIEQPSMKTAKQNWPEVYTDAYLETLQAHIEALHTKVAAHSTTNPTDPVFINYKHEDNPDALAPHLAKVDPGQLVTPPEGMEAGYVPVIISVYHPEERSYNGSGYFEEPDPTCSNGAWTDTYHPNIP